MRLASLTFAVICGATLTGCSGHDDALPMSASEVEDFVKASLNDDARDPVGVDSVACEGGLENELDDRTFCAVTLENGDRSGEFESLLSETTRASSFPTSSPELPRMGWRLSTWSDDLSSCRRSRAVLPMS